MGRLSHPRIGINADYVPTGKTTGAYARLNAGYYDTIATAGGLPIILPPVVKEPDPYLDLLDGLVLSSGLDLDPKRQGLPSHAAVQPMPPRREQSDRLLIRRALERKLPLLAIGGGMQHVNVLCGGSLYLHLPEDLPRSLPHRDSTGGPHRHIVLVEAGTRLEEIYGGGEIRINSDHHQAVRLVAPGFRVGARAPDGVIEALESTDSAWFCIGVQWHPESETASALDMQLFENFIQACLSHGQALDIAA